MRKSKFAAFLRHGREMTSRRIIGHTRLTGRFTHRSREDRRRRRLTGHAAAPRRGAAPGRPMAPVHDAEDCVEIKFYARSLNRRVVLHAIDATLARWRGDAGSSHATHWLISSQAEEERRAALPGGPGRGAALRARRRAVDGARRAPQGAVDALRPVDRRGPRPLLGPAGGSEVQG